MKLSIPKNDIQGVLGKVQGLTNRKSNLAITATVLIQTEKDMVSISATDLETGFTGIYPAEIEEEGAICLNSKMLFDIVRDYPAEQIPFEEQENGQMLIGEKNVVFHLKGMNPEDYPTIPKSDNTECFQMDTIFFRKMIERTAMIYPPKDDKREHVIGVFMEKKEVDEGISVRLVATDGNRLAKADYLYGPNSTIPLEPKVLIPKKGLIEAGKFLDTPGMVEIGIKNNMLVMKKDSETLIIRLLEGEFPEYDDIIGIMGATPIYVDRERFLMMLKRMSIMTQEDFKTVFFKFLKNRLTIESTNPELGDSKEDMDVEYSGKEIKIAFNPAYFIDSLNAVDTDLAVLHLMAEDKPCVVQGKEDPTYFCAIMPMNY